eukprot:TRINITY_DN11307_c0_g1_i1.p1 TRINITY_DN11307_c0_g1~~TRINITY_DN11307_c0_g1_i1.p1  ORF type:complete len:328 (+),score=36.59 TRINITY_DN11307_c0_g1_i1:23-985(+)
MTTRIKFGIVGLGVHGMRYANHLIKGDIPNACLTAVSRRGDEGRIFAEANSCLWFSDYTDLCKSDVDVVIICTPTSSHCEVAVKAASCGKHVIVEKPMASTTAECQQMIDAATQYSVKLTVAHTQRFDRITATFREEVQTMHPLLTASMTYRLEPPRKPRCGASWDSALYDLCSHLFDTLRYMTGQEFKSVRCQCDYEGELKHNFALVWITLSSGTEVKLEVSSLCRTRVGRLEALCPSHQIIGDCYNLTLHRVQAGGKLEAVDVPMKPMSLISVMLEMQRAVTSNTEPSITGLDGWKTVRALEACVESSKSDSRRIDLQ